MKRTTEPEQPPYPILVQAIQVRWTKASRGAPGAAARNRVPEALTLPHSKPSAPPKPPPTASVPPWSRPPEIMPAPQDSGLRSPDLSLHRVSYGESNPFREPTADSWIAFKTSLPAQTTLLAAPTVPPLTFIGASAGLQVTFWWHEIAGSPRRHRHHRHNSRGYLTLTPGQWGKMRFNARLSGTFIPWLYDKWVLNVGLSVGPASDLFVSGPPSVLLSDMADLF